MLRENSTDDLEVKFDIKPGGVKVEVTIKDHRVFPELDSEDPAKMSRFAKGMTDGLINFLSNPMFQKGGKMKEGKIRKVACAKCSHIFEITMPCCNKKEVYEDCPNCGTKNRIPLT